MSSDVRQLTIVGRVFKSKGYGIRIQRLLKVCERVNKLELVGIDDLRPKHLVSNKTLTHLSLLNTSFRPHSLVNPPNLVSFTSSLTHLTLSNLGLPPPSTHLSTLISLASKTLKYLAISSIRDVESLEFHKTFSILATECPKLSTLVLGFLTDEQVETLSLPLLSSTTSCTPSTSYPILSRLSNLRSLTFTLPLPTLPLLLSLPPSLQTLSIRPPYSRQTLSNPHITSHSKIALLRVLNPVPSPSSTNTRGTNTPLFDEEGASVGSMMRSRRTRSVPLGLLEEEETILSFLSIALSPNPPPLPPTSILGKGVGVGMSSTVQSVKSTPLVCHGHTRPVPSIDFSPLLAPTSSSPSDPNYLLISACKDGKPMLRDWVGDWQGTFWDDKKGHKGAVWEARLSKDASLALTGSADFSA
ncbi:hypothetical protein JCM16303_006487, partial [Sporobolomyces ruberrimus]